MSRHSQPLTQPDEGASQGGSRGQVRPAVGAELAAVRALVEPLARSHGVDVVDVEWANGPQGRILRVTLERDDGTDLAPLAAAAAAEAAGETGAGTAAAGGPLGALAGSGVTLDDCVQVSRDISTVLDIEDVVSGRYSLEVSSPGLERSLRTQRDFHRHRGLLAKVKLHRPAEDGQRVLRGIIVGCEEQLLMEVDGKAHSVALEDVARAHLVFVPKTGIKRGGAKRGAAGKRKTRGKNKRGKR